jgi:hypothetical protein
MIWSDRRWVNFHQNLIAIRSLEYHTDQSEELNETPVKLSMAMSVDVLNLGDTVAYFLLNADVIVISIFICLLCVCCVFVVSLLYDYCIIMIIVYLM